MNIVISNVSYFNVKDGKITTSEYKAFINNKEKKFKGEITNEAPIKYINKKCSGLDKVFLIASNKVKTKEETFSNEKGKKFTTTTIDYLKKKLRFAKNKYEVFDIADEPNETQVADTVYQIYDRLSKEAEEKKDEEICVYIEANGGVRYVLTMLLTLTKTLERFYENINIKEIDSMVYTVKPTLIKNTKNIFDTAQIYGVVDEFINFGRIDSLKKYVNTLYENKSIPEDIESVIKKLEDISDHIQMCRTNMLLEDFYGNSNIKEVIDTFTSNHNNDKSVEVSIFRHVIDLINKEFASDIYSRETASLNENIPRMIAWCVKKNYVMQALTLCSENSAKYLYDTGKLSYRAGSDIDTDINTSRGDYEGYYYFLAHFNDFRKAAEKKLNEGYLNDQSLYNPHMKKYWDMTTEYMGMTVSNINDTNKIINLLKKHGIDVNTSIAISNAIKNNNIVDTLQGKYITNDGSKMDHNNLDTNDNRVQKVLGAACKMYKEADKSEYESVVKDILKKMNLDDSIIGKFLDSDTVTKQSNKYFLSDVVDTNGNGDISTNMKKDELQKLLYIYSMCKEQRNMTNHANVTDPDLALNPDNIKILIGSYLEML